MSFLQNRWHGNSVKFLVAYICTPCTDNVNIYLVHANVSGVFLLRELNMVFYLLCFNTIKQETKSYKKSEDKMAKRLKAKLKQTFEVSSIIKMCATNGMYKIYKTVNFQSYYFSHQINVWY